MKIYQPSTWKPFFVPGDELADAKKAFDMVHHIACVDALSMCLEMHQNPPDWVADIFQGSLAKVLRLKGLGVTAPSASAAKRVRDDLRHYHRYDAVKVAMEADKKGEAKWEYAEKLLKGTVSAGGRHTIENSYDLGCSALKKPDGKLRFRYPRSSFAAR